MLAAVGIMLGAPARTTSPDGHIVFDLAADSAGHPVYTITMDGRPVITSSRLGIAADDTERTSGRTTPYAYIRP